MNRFLSLFTKSARAMLAALIAASGPAAPAWGQAVAAVVRIPAAGASASAGAAFIGAAAMAPAAPGLPGLNSNLAAAGLTPSLNLALPAPLSRAAAADKAAPGLRFVAASAYEVPVRPASPLKSAVLSEPLKAAGRSVSPFRRLIATVGKSVKANKTQALFDGGFGTGILPDAGEAPAGVDLDPIPSRPGDGGSRRVSWQNAGLPGGRGTLSERFLGRPAFRPVELPGAPQTAEGIEEALRSLMGRMPESFGGLTQSDFKTELAHKVPGQEGLADMVYVNMSQVIDGHTVDGTYLNFAIKLGAGRTVVAASAAEFFPELVVGTGGRLDEEELLAAAYERLGRPASSTDDLTPLGRRIMHLGGAWRAVQMFHSESKHLVAAVDVNTGETFAWNPRMSAARATGGEIAGRGVAHGPQDANAVIGELPMSHTEVTTSDGRTFYTDAEGNFTLEGAPSDTPVTVTARLKGRYAAVSDRVAANLEVTATLRPGETVKLLFNPEGSEENAVAQVNAYRHVNVVHDWVVSKGLNIARLNQAIPVRTNDRRDCNAYYTPWSPSLNFFNASERCANTSFDSVVYHEFGHFVDDMIGGIVNGALSEGWGDILSMYITGNAAIGEGFLRQRTPSYIRHGENDYRFAEGDEVHKQGQAWMGFGWKLRKALIASARAHGLSLEAAEKKATDVASALVIPVFLASVRDIPAAIQAVLLRDTDADGNAPHFAEIQAAAAAHGIEVERPGLRTRNPFAGKSGFLPWLARLFARLRD